MIFSLTSQYRFAVFAPLVDLSADYRIKDVAVYEKWYGIEHKSPQFIEEAVYGLCEVNRGDVKKARLVANLS